MFFFFNKNSKASLFSKLLKVFLIALRSAAAAGENYCRTAPPPRPSLLPRWPLKLKPPFFLLQVQRVHRKAWTTRTACLTHKSNSSVRLLKFSQAKSTWRCCPCSHYLIRPSGWPPSRRWWIHLVPSKPTPRRSSPPSAPKKLRIPSAPLPFGDVSPNIA